MGIFDAAGFFDARVEDANRNAARSHDRSRQRPPTTGWNDIPAPVPFARLIWRGATAAAAIGGVAATPGGFGFTVSARWRNDDDGDDWRRDSEFVVTLIFADGREALEGRYGRAPGEPELIKRNFRGSGDMRYGDLEADYWATPLPPPGTLTLGFTWPSRAPAHEAEPVHVALDAAAIIEAAGRAGRFFDEVPGVDARPNAMEPDDVA